MDVARGLATADDPGLNAARESSAPWPGVDAELAENPNRRGFVRASENGHALRYADGTPFFLVGDTWLAASTWRLPFKGAPRCRRLCAGRRHQLRRSGGLAQTPGLQLHLVHRRLSRTGPPTNTAPPSRTRTACFCATPGRSSAHWAPNAKISTADGATTTAKDMHDEQGNRPFEVFADREGLANFDRINPKYFASLDRKMRHLSDEGFVPFLETIRRDNAPSWKRTSTSTSRTRASCNTSSRATARTTWCSAASTSTGFPRISASRPMSSTRR